MASQHAEWASTVCKVFEELKLDVAACNEEEISEKAAQLEEVCGQTPLRISGASQKGVPETVQKLFQIISEDRRAQREAQIEAEKTPEQKEEGWTP